MIFLKIIFTLKIIKINFFYFLYQYIKIIKKIINLIFFKINIFLKNHFEIKKLTSFKQVII
jgi:hypothetical protein